MAFSRVGQEMNRPRGENDPTLPLEAGVVLGEKLPDDEFDENLRQVKTRYNRSRRWQGTSPPKKPAGYASLMQWCY